jgi:ribosomal subunit interface protein
MNYNVKGTGLQVTDEIRSYIEKKLTHADKFLQHDSTAHADVEVVYHITEGKHYRAEFTVSSEGEVYRAEALGDTLHEALDLATDELTQELRKTKKKNLSLTRSSAGKFKDFIRGFTDRF